MLRTLLALLALLACWSAVACSVPVEVPSTSPATAPPVELPSAEVARARLAGLRLAAREAHAGTYVRAEFGSSWADVDGNGCNQRDDVLFRDAVPGTVVVAPQGRCDRDVLAGTWVDPYSGRTLRFHDLKEPAQARGVQIDHMESVTGKAKGTVRPAQSVSGMSSTGRRGEWLTTSKEF